MMIQIPTRDDERGGHDHEKVFIVLFTGLYIEREPVRMPCTYTNIQLNILRSYMHDKTSEYLIFRPIFSKTMLCKEVITMSAT